MPRTNKNSPLTCLNVHWFCIKMSPLITLLYVSVFKKMFPFLPLCPWQLRSISFPHSISFRFKMEYPVLWDSFLWEVSIFFHEGICLSLNPLHVIQSSTEALLVTQWCRVWAQAELCQTAEEDFVQTCWRHLLRKTHIGIFHKDWWLA